MEIQLNNNKEIIERDQLTLAELIQYKNFTFPMLVTKINGLLVKKVDRDNVMIKAGDDVIVLHLISGG
ncbi:MAG: sulfur carrier protein ThiS [Bacteroidales bacterium]|nr:sulfur carrier protein ThiS [Bacteroidales bacterium]